MEKKKKKDKLWFRFILWVFIDAMSKNTPAGKRVDFSTRYSFFLGMTVWRGEQKEKNKMNGAKENRRNNFPQYN